MRGAHREGRSTIGHARLSRQPPEQETRFPGLSAREFPCELSAEHRHGRHREIEPLRARHCRIESALADRDPTAFALEHVDSVQEGAAS
jgi:hypothetical protein